MLSQSFEDQRQKWIRKMRRDRLSPRTINFYAETIHAVAEILNKFNRPYMPREISTSDVIFFMDLLASEGYAVQTRKGYISTLRRWCVDGGSRIKVWPKPRLPADMRPKVDWLTTEQAAALLAYKMTPLQSVVVSLELRQGLRHVEVIRLRVSDVDLDGHLLTVTGKGPIGGKPRLVPLVTATETTIKDWLAVRSRWTEEGRARYPKSFEDSEYLIVWRKGGRLSAYSEEGYGLDKVVTLPLSKALGFHFSNHTLRRTFGRALYRSGVPVATIAKILGHESTEVTLRYIGVDIDDMRMALSKEIFL